MKLSERSKLFDERQVGNSDVDLFADGLVLGEHGKDDALGCFVKNGEDFSGCLRQEVGQNFSLRGQDVVIDLETGPVFFAHLTNSFSVKVVTSSIYVGPQKVSESVVNFGTRSGHADVLADCATSGVFQVLNGLKHVT